MAISQCLRQLIVVFVAVLCLPSLAWSALKSGGVTTQDPGAPTAYALFVGINGYEVGPVAGAVKDAKAAFARLTDESLGLVRPENSILLLEEEAFDGAAIDAALDDLLARGDANDVVIFFFSGRSEYDIYADDLFLFP